MTRYTRADLNTMVRRYMEEHPDVSLAGSIVDALLAENRALLPQKRELRDVAESQLSFS